MLAQTNVTVTDEPKLILTSRVGGSKIKIGNTGGKAVYIGGSNVTKDNGLTLANNAIETFELACCCSIYAVVATGTTEIVILEY
jgi:hypothetical protein